MSDERFTPADEVPRLLIEIESYERDRDWHRDLANGRMRIVQSLEERIVTLRALVAQLDRRVFDRMTDAELLCAYAARYPRDAHRWAQAVANEVQRRELMTKPCPSCGADPPANDAIEAHDNECEVWGVAAVRERWLRDPVLTVACPSCNVFDLRMKPGCAAAECAQCASFYSWRELRAHGWQG